MSNREELLDTQEAILETQRALDKLKAFEAELVAVDDGWLPQSVKRAAAKRASLDASRALSKFRRRR